MPCASIARDPSGRILWTWVLPTRDLRADVSALAAREGSPVRMQTQSGRLTLKAGAAGAELDLVTGALLALTYADRRLDLGGGPKPADGRSAVTASVRHFRDGGRVVVEATYDQGLTAVRWVFYPTGWLRLDFEYRVDGSPEVFGIGFDLPREKIEHFRWLGGGPARVWKNRLPGARLGVWEKAARGATPLAAPHEPKLAGYYADVVWARLTTSDGDLVIALGPDLYLGLLAAEFPDDARDAVATVPASGISFLHGISAIGTKFHPPQELGPQSQPNDASGVYRGTVWFHSGPPPSPVPVVAP